MQHGAVLKAQHKRLARIGAGHIHLEVPVGECGLVQCNAKVVENELRSHVVAHVRRSVYGCLHERLVAVPELQGRREVAVAPRAALCLIAQLFERVGAQQARLGVLRVGKHESIRDLRDPLVLALLEIGTGALQHCRWVAQVRGKLGGVLLRAKVVQMHRVCVVPTHIALVHGPGIMGDRAIVLTGVPAPLKLGRQCNRLGDFR